METILILDDDPASRQVLAAVLGDKAGYDVLTADSPEAGLLVCTGHQGQLALLIADVILRNSDGESVPHIRGLLPPVPVLYISGYPFDLLLNRGLLDAVPFQQQKAFFLQKPFTPRILIQTVQDIIGGTDHSK